MGVASLGLAWAGATTTSDVALAVTVISIGRRLPDVAGAVVVLVLLAASEAIFALRWGQLNPANLLFTTLGTGALYALVVTMGRLRREQDRTQAALEELRLSREAQVEAARTAERVRLAREIHDVLGHTLSALAVQLEGARLLLEREDAAPTAVEAVSRAHRLAREGLDEARRAVGTLRGDDLPGPDLLPGLVEDFARDSGTDARLAVDGEPAALAPEARLALYRTAQEALTNVRRHARPSRVDLRLRWEPGGAELTVENDGVTAGVGPARAGYGLAGMRERAELLGGNLELGAGDGRFRVRLWVPAAEAGE
jgi:signal transduction histidine kinase